MWLMTTKSGGPCEDLITVGEKCQLPRILTLEDETDNLLRNVGKKSLTAA
jgi:hypothetical protein